MGSRRCVYCYLFKQVGHEQVRSLWKEYFVEADAIVFLVDSTEIERMGECMQELQAVLNDPNLHKTHFLILGNKQDLDGALSKEQLIQQLQLHKVLDNQTEERRVLLFTCSLVDGTGYAEGFRALAEIIQ